MFYLFVYFLQQYYITCFISLPIGHTIVIPGVVGARQLLCNIFNKQYAVVDDQPYYSAFFFRCRRNV